MRERDVRAWVALGSGIERPRVMPRLAGSLPREGVYATVLLMFEEHQDLTPGERRDPSDGNVDVRQRIRSTFSVQWFRPGADEAARRFRAFALSDYGDLVSSSGFDAVATDEERAEWEPFVVGLPFPEVRQIDAIMARMALPGEGVPDDVEERRSVDLAVEWLQDSHHPAGRLTAVPIEHGGETQEIR